MNANAPTVDEFVSGRAPFLAYLSERRDGCAPASLREIITSAGSPERVVIIAVDVINGFCRSGALASARVDTIVDPIVTLLRRAQESGVRHVALPCDQHTVTAAEFAQFAPHSLQGTWESEPVDELKALPWYETFVITPKNSLSPWHADGALAAWWQQRRAEGVAAVIALGDCTDLCLHQLALSMKLAANQANEPLRIVVPRDCVQTYDLPLDTARAVGALPHDGDLLHEVFLYHLALNGVEVVSTIGA